MTWIPIAERMPEAGKLVLALRDAPRPTSRRHVLARWTGHGVVFETDFESRKVKTVTHWQELEAPPEEHQ